jgi:diacylglycerol O-acyltransferase
MSPTMTSRPCPMSPVDVAWLRMDHPTNLMVVSALLSFERPPDWSRLVETVERRLLIFDRFRQRVVERGRLRRRPCWEEDRHFDLATHLRRYALPSPGDEQCLREVVGRLVSTPLHPGMPLWQLHLIEGYREGDALLARIHHSIGDGMALMRVLLSLTDGEAAEPADVAGRQPARPGLTAGVGSLARSLLRGVGQMRATRLLDLAGEGLAGVGAAGHLLLRPADFPTVLKGALGVEKRVAWSDEVPLEKIKEVGRITGCTVNDVLLAAVSGALRRYLERRGAPAAAPDVHAAVPVDLRRPDEPLGLGNRFGLVFVSLPVSVREPLERLFEVRRRMDRLKAGPEAGVALKILGGLGLTSAGLQKTLVELVGAKTTAVITNVPGPRQRVQLAGAAVRGMMFWVPMSGRVGLGVSLLSYAGGVRLGIATDGGLVPDPERLVAGFQHELAAYGRLVRLPEVPPAVRA